MAAAQPAAAAPAIQCSPQWRLLPMNTDRTVAIPIVLRAGAIALALAMTAGILLGGRVPGATSWIVAPWDKLVHALAYGALAASWYVGLGGGGARRMLRAVLIAIATGAVDEWLQRDLPGRQPELVDLLADTLGAFAGCWVSSVLLPLVVRVLRSLGLR